MRTGRYYSRFLFITDPSRYGLLVRLQPFWQTETAIHIGVGEHGGSKKIGLLRCYQKEKLLHDQKDHLRRKHLALS